MHSGAVFLFGRIQTKGLNGFIQIVISLNAAASYIGALVLKKKKSFTNRVPKSGSCKTFEREKNLFHLYRPPRDDCLFIRLTANSQNPPQPFWFLKAFP